MGAILFPRYFWSPNGYLGFEAATTLIIDYFIDEVDHKGRPFVWQLVDFHTSLSRQNLLFYLLSIRPLVRPLS